MFEAIARANEALHMNIELAAPDDFIPPLPDWRQRSVFVARHGEIDFLQYDFCAQALAKIERGHPRYAAIDIPSFRRRVEVAIETAGRAS